MAQDKIVIPVELDISSGNNKGLISGIKRDIAKVFEDIKNSILGNVERRIKNVDSWDGSASRWESTDAYCRDCLIDVNEVAGRSEKAQSHCMLPIREPGDNQNTYVWQAVVASAGGRRITRLQKPDDVPQEAWDMAIKEAADEIIMAYEQNDEIAPDSVFEVAGEEPERSRAISIDDFVSSIYEKAAMMIGEDDFYLMDIFHNDNGMYVIINYEGALWRMWITVEDNEVMLSEPEQVIMEFMPSERSLVVRQQENGLYRFVAIACTSVLNRVGEIDTTMLFDKFAENFANNNVEADLYHLRNSDVGNVDFVARDGYTLIVSGTFYDDKLGKATARGIQNKPDMWGTSIMYTPLNGDMINIEGVEIPIFTDGILRKVTILQEKDAAALFTAIANKNEMEVRQMNKTIKDKLLGLFGNDETLIDELENRVDDVNERVNQDKLIARQNEQVDGETEEVSRESDVKAENDKPVISEAEVIIDLRNRVAILEETNEGLSNVLEAVAKETAIRLSRLERSEADRKRAYLADLPYRSGVSVQTPDENFSLYRPRQERSGDGNMPASEKAQAIMSQKSMKLSGRG